MTFNEAIIMLKQNKIVEFLYCDELGGLGGGECYGVEVVNQNWHVYYSERGAKSLICKFPSESEAIDFFVAKVQAYNYDFHQN